MIIGNAESLFAWVTRYPDGTVGTISALVNLPPVGRMNTVLVGRTRGAVETLFGPVAREHGRRLKQEVWLREYRDYIDHEETRQ